MKFARNVRILRGRLDVAPFAAVFFLLAIFVLLSSMVYTPGVRLDLPGGEGLPGTDRPGVAVAMDATGRLYFENQVIEEADLRTKLSQAAAASAEPLILVVQADKLVTYERIVKLTLLARDAGITNAWLATLHKPKPVRGG